MRPSTCKICKAQFHVQNKEEWNENGMKCPVCNELYCVLPDTERSLRILQDKFFINREEKYLSEMYYILMEYAQSLFLKFFNKVVLHTEDLDYYLQNAISFFIEEYLLKEDYKIKISFGGLLIYKIKQALFSKNEYLSEFSLDYEMQDKHIIQRKDDKNYFGEVEKSCDNYFLKNYLYKLIIEISNYSDSPLENYMREQALYLHLTNGEKYVDRFFKLYNKKGKLIYMYTLEVLKKQLKKSIEISYN